MFKGKDRFLRGIAIWLTLSLQGVSAEFKKVLYDPVQWPPMIYKQVTYSVTSEVECAGLCKIEEPMCQAFSFLVSECLLGDPLGSFSVIPLSQTMSRPVHLVPGPWLPWSDWSLCINNNNNDCGTNVQGLKNRTRECSFPNPVGSKTPCPGTNQEASSCTAFCPVNGAWSKWSDWSTCSQFCGLGEQIRNRSCNDPKPKFGGSSCPNATVDEKSCDKSCRAGALAMDQSGGSGEIWEYCANSFHVILMSTAVTTDGIDGIRLTCNDPGGQILKSTERNGIGYNNPTLSCAGGFNGTRGNIEPDGGVSHDDHGLICVELLCAETGIWMRSNCGDLARGVWHEKMCGSNQVICGLQTRYYSSKNDHVGVQFFSVQCCHLPDQ